MSLSPKLVAVLGVFQVIFIAAGFCATRAFLHSYAQMAPVVFRGYALPVPALPAFIRAFGLWFALIPMIWAGFTVVQAENNWGVISISQRDALIGIVLAVGLALFFGASAWEAFALLGQPVEF